MKTLSFWKKSVYSALVFFGTVTALTIGYGALFGGLTTADKVGTGSGLTATSWNRIVDGVLDLDTRLSNLTFSGNNVGIGVSPSTKLEVNGSITLGEWDGLARINFPYTGYSTMVLDKYTDGFYMGDGSTWRIAIKDDGKIGIGTTSPAERLDLGGGNIKMGYEIVSWNGTTAAWTWTSATATCPTGKQALGWACYQPSATCASFFSEITAVSYACNYFNCNATAAFAARATCANIR